MAPRPELQKAKPRRSGEIPLQLARRQLIPNPTLNAKAQRYNEASQDASEVDVGISIPVLLAESKKICRDKIPEGSH